MPFFTVYRFGGGANYDMQEGVIFFVLLADGLLSLPFCRGYLITIFCVCCTGWLPLPILGIASYVMFSFSRSERQRSRAGLKVTPGGKMVKQAPL